MLECGKDWQPVQTPAGTWIYARRVDGSTLEAFSCRQYRTGQSRQRGVAGGGGQQRLWRDTVRFREDAIPSDVVCGFLTADGAAKVAGAKVPGTFDADAWVNGLLDANGIQ